MSQPELKATIKIDGDVAALCFECARRFGVTPFEMWFHAMAFKMGYRKVDEW